MSRFKTIIALIFAVGVALFAVQNYEEVIIKFLFYNIKVSQALVIVLSTAFGVIIGLIAGLNSSFRASKSVKQMNKETAEAQQKITALENENKQLKDEVKTLTSQGKVLGAPGALMDPDQSSDLDSDIDPSFK